MDPVLTAIAGALAKEAVTGGAKALGKLVKFVKEKFRHDTGAEVVLATAQENPDDPRNIDMLARVLHATGEKDPAFVAELKALWAASNTEVTATTVTQNATAGGAANNVNGNVSGNVVQAGDITGGITIHR
jgi:hypothetical protein